MSFEEAIQENTKVLTAVLDELKSIKTVLAKQEVDTCTVKEALEILGLNNDRYMTYFFKQQLLNRRKGGSGFLYFKSECVNLAIRIKNNQVTVPPMKSIYEKQI